MKKTGSILAIFLIASLFLSISVVHAQHTEPDDLGICAKVSNVDLNGQGNYLEVGTDEAYMITLDYQTWSWVDENRRQQIIIGLDDEPFWCVYDGISMAYSSSNGHGRTLTEIQKPGTYNLMWMTTFCNNPKDEMDFYKSHPELREKIGMIKVMDCGGGICNTYCEVIGINLNGQNDYLEIGPGETIKITIYYEIWNPIDCPECTQQIVIGLEGTPMYCAYNGVPGIHPGILDHDQVFYEMTAPTEPGIYNIMWMNTMGYTCDDAKNLYRGLPLLRKKVGTIKVVSSGKPAWEELSHSTIKDKQGNVVAEVKLMGQLPHPLVERLGDYYIEIERAETGIETWGQVYILYKDEVGYISPKYIMTHLFNDSTGRWEVKYKYEEIDPRIRDALELMGILPTTSDLLMVLSYKELPQFITERVDRIFGVAEPPPTEVVSDWDKDYDMVRVSYEIPDKYKKIRICFKAEYSKLGNHPMLIWVSLREDSAEMRPIIPVE